MCSRCLRNVDRSGDDFSLSLCDEPEDDDSSMLDALCNDSSTQHRTSFAMEVQVSNTVSFLVYALVVTCVTVCFVLLELLFFILHDCSHSSLLCARSSCYVYFSGENCAAGYTPKGDVHYMDDAYAHTTVHFNRFVSVFKRTLHSSLPVQTSQNTIHTFTLLS